jgi:DNA-binding response OmpR family regulator
MYKIFIVEDDESIATLIREYLERWGFEAACARDFMKITEEIRAFSPHLVIIDISLPFFNGYYWCEQLRRESKVPVIFVSSHAQNMDIVMAMNVGADDYIFKPFSLDVLLAKINALLRRVYSYNDKSLALEARGALLGGDGMLALHGAKIELTKNEYRILKMLLENKNTIVSRETIMRALWDSESFIDDNTLTVNVNRLRKKLEQAGLADFIATKKGEGYMVCD